MNPEQCPIKGCTYSKRLVLCPLHWDLVDPAMKLTIYELGRDLDDEELSDDVRQKTVEKYVEIEGEIIKAINGRRGA